MCVIAVVGVAPCQCFSFGASQTNVPRIDIFDPFHPRGVPIHSRPAMSVAAPRTESNRRMMMMSNLKVEALAREFQYNGIRIPDPGPELSVDQVRDLLTPQFPEIATESLYGPEATGTALRYTFIRAIGTKG